MVRRAGFPDDAQTPRATARRGARRRRAPPRSGFFATERARSTCSLNSAVLATSCVVGEPLDLGLPGVHLGHDRLDRLQAFALAGVEDLVEQTHAIDESTGATQRPNAAAVGLAGPPGGGAIVTTSSLDRPAFRARRTSRPRRASAPAASPGCCGHGCVRCSRRDDELGRDVLVGEAAGDQAQHLELAVGEPADVVLLFEAARQFVELREQLRGHRRRHE